MRPEPATEVGKKRMEPIRLPVVVEQKIGTIVLVPDEKREIVGTALGVITDFVNDMTEARATATLPMRFSFDNGEGQRFTVTIDSNES